MKKPLLIIIILLLVGIGVAVFVNFPKMQTNIQTLEIPLSGEIISSGNNTSGATDFLSGVSGEIKSGTIQPVIGTTNTQSNNPLVYTNTEFGFQLTLPEGWEEYRAFVYDMKDNGYNSGELADIVIALPTHSPRPGVQYPNDPNRFVSGYTGQYQYITGYADMILFKVWTHEGYQQAINTPDDTATKLLFLLAPVAKAFTSPAS